MISFVIATYNNAAVLERCLAAWEKYGSSEEMEIIVVADGCTDGTHALLERIAGTPWGQKTMRWVVENNVHELKCTNRGVREARGDLVVSWHDDMFISCDWLVPEIVANFAAYPELGVLALSRGLICSDLDAPVVTWEDSLDWRRLKSTIGPAPMNWVKLHEVDAVIRPWVVRMESLQGGPALDEVYKLTEWDEADMCFRLRERGWLTAAHGYERDGAYSHLVSTTFGKTPAAARQATALHNALIFQERWRSAIATGTGRTLRSWWRRMSPRSISATLGSLTAHALRRRPADNGNR